MSAPQKEPINLALGVEKLGLISLRWPAVIAILVAIITAVAGYGITRIKVDDSLSQLFRSDTPEYQQYEAVTRRFPSSEFDVLIVVEGDGILTRDTVGRMRDLALDVQLVPGTLGIISMFSAREAPKQEGEIPPPLFPDDLPEGADYDKLIEQVKTNEIIRGKLMSDDGTLALMVLSLKPEVVESGELRSTIDEIRDVVDQDLEGSTVTGRLSGVPVMQLEIRNAVERDRLIYNVFGFVAGCLIAVLFFRRLSFMIIAAAPPLIGIVWSLGFLGWLDFRLNMFLNVMTPLIMVLGFSDSMQLTFAARDRLLQGDSKFEAMRRAILVVGPACVLTSLAAGLSFVALLFSDSHLIRAFGAAGAMSAVIAFVAVITLMPLLGVLLVRKEANFAAKVAGADRAINALRGVCTWIAERMVRRPLPYTIASVIVVLGLTVVYANLEPRYRLADQVPDRQQAVAAAEQLDAKLTGANPIDVLIELPPGRTVYDPESIATIAAVHATIEEQAGVGNVWSLESLHRWLTEKAGKSDIPTLKSYVDILPVHLVRRFVAEDQNAAVVSGRIPDIDANELLPVIDRLDGMLDTVRVEHPGTTIAVTGLAAIAARNSAAMITKLSTGLTIEMAMVALLLGLAFRSLFVTAVAVLPGLFPIVIAGAVLWWFGEGLQFASIVALTVAFGLGLSATIHYLNRLRLEYRPDEHPSLGIKRATTLVGPALILTTLVLAFGLGVTIFSDLPSLRLFGWLSAFTLIAALIGDLLILPATVMWLRNSLRWLRGRLSSPQAAE